MSAAPWHCDRPLDERIVRAVVETQFPTLRPGSCRLLGSGWDHDAWLVNDAWVFRFPRRAGVVEASLRERALLPVVADALDLPVPRPVFLGEPGPHFPYPFAGHRFLAGVPADAAAVAAADEPRIAEAVGRALARLHALPLEPLAHLGVPHLGDRTRRWRDRVRDLADAIRGVLPSETLARWEPWLRGEIDPPAPAPGPWVLGHNDLGAEHVLLDPATRRVAALLDWGDAAVVDPALDFAGLCFWRGDAFLERMLAAYDRPADGGLRARVRFVACAIGLTLVGESVRGGDAAGLARWRRFFLEVFEPRHVEAQAASRRPCDGGRARRAAPSGALTPAPPPPRECPLPPPPGARARTPVRRRPRG